MKNLIFILITISLPVLLIAQSEKTSGQNIELNSYQSIRQTNFIGELGGNGMLFSLGMEHAKFDNKILKNTIRWGVSFLPVKTYAVFGEYNIDFGKNKNYFELGAGPTLYWDQGLNVFILGRIGYRYISDSFIFRVGFTPYLLMNKDIILTPHFGITLGIPLKCTLH